MIAKIADDLLSLAYPVEKLKLLPGNPNLGDVNAVAKLYDKVGQRKPIVARREENGEEIVIAGNTQLQAARDKLGWTHIAVSWADDLSQQEAITYALGDNKTADLGETDPEAERDMLRQIDDDMEYLMAAGYDLADIQEMDDIIDIDLPEIEELEMGPNTGGNTEPQTEVRSIGTPVIQYTIVFDTEVQQQHWFRFIKWLKSEAYPELDTNGARLFEFFEDNNFWD